MSMKKESKSAGAIAPCLVEFYSGSPEPGLAVNQIACQLSAYEILIPEFDPGRFKISFGTEFTTGIRLVKESKRILKVQTRLIKSETLHERSHSLSYFADEHIRDEIKKHISNSGSEGPNFVRVVPRIDELAKYPWIPTQALVYPKPTTSPRCSDNYTIFQVFDISPVGLQLASESKHAFDFAPGDHVEVILEPRGSTKSKIILLSQVARIRDVFDWATKNYVRTLGVEIAQMNNRDLVSFHELIRMAIRGEDPR